MKRNKLQAEEEDRMPCPSCFYEDIVAALTMMMMILTLLHFPTSQFRLRGECKVCDISSLVICELHLSDLFHWVLRALRRKIAR